MARQVNSQLNLLLIGKTGSGRSRTGNSILGKMAFPVYGQANLGTATKDLAESEYNGTLIKVVDVPGVGDTRYNQEEGLEHVKTRIKEAMLLSPEGYDGFLYVTKYGARFTEEDVAVLNFLKDIFGENFVKDMCILIVTCGDNFEADHEDEGLTFEKWCKKESGHFGRLMEECGNRILLFDNKTKDETKQIDQIDKLLSQVENLKRQNQNKRYTDINFEEVMALKSKDFDKQEKIVTKVSLLLQKLGELNGEYNLDKLLKLSSHCAQVLLSIQKQEENHFLKEIKEKLRELQTSINKSCLLYSSNSDEIERIERILNVKIRELDLIYQTFRPKYNFSALLDYLKSGVLSKGFVALGAAGAAFTAGLQHVRQLFGMIQERNTEK